MAVNLGSAILFFKGDTKGLSKSLKSAGATLGKFFKSISGVMKKIAKVGALALAAGFATLAGIVVKSIKEFGAYGDELDKMSKRTGIAVEALAELSHAAQLGGTDIGAVEKSIRMMQKVLIEARDGVKTYTDALDNLNLKYEDLADLSPEDQFSLIAERLNAVEDATLKSAIASEIFGGRAGTALLPMIENLKEAREEAARFGVVLSEVDTKIAADFTDEMFRLRQSIKGVFLAIGRAFIQWASRQLRRGQNFFIKVRQLVEKNVDKFKAMGVTFARIGASLWGALFGVNTGILETAQKGIDFVLRKLKELASWLEGKGQKVVREFGESILEVVKALGKLSKVLLKITPEQFAWGAVLVGIVFWLSIMAPAITAVITAVKAMGVVMAAVGLGPLAAIVLGLAAGVTVGLKFGDTILWLIRGPFGFLSIGLKLIDKQFQIIMATIVKVIEKIRQFLGLSSGIAVIGPAAQGVLNRLGMSPEELNRRALERQRRGGFRGLRDPSATPFGPSRRSFVTDAELFQEALRGAGMLQGVGQVQTTPAAAPVINAPININVGGVVDERTVRQIAEEVDAVLSVRSREAAQRLGFRPIGVR